MNDSHSLERAEQVQNLFDEAVDLDADARAAYLDQACADDAIRREVESLLDAHDNRAGDLRLALEHLLLAPQPTADGPGKSVEPDADPLVGQTFSSYTILEKLGGGGMGVVYKARDAKLDRLVALKFLPPHLSLDAEAKARFIHEAKAASALDHVNLGYIHEIDETEEGHLFIAMAFYAGETLKQKIARGPLPLADALDYAMQVAQGLSKAHAAGIVHRDIKPANVMVTTEGVAKVVDFGLAKRGDVSLTKTGTTLGTVAYMSPEQARGETVDQRTDLWSLGVVLYEMLAGQRPFRGDYSDAVIYSVLHEEPTPLREVRPEAPEELARIVEKALAKQPEERYQQAQELQVDLRSLRGEGEAVQPEAGRAVAASSRRRRVVRYSSVAALVLVLAGLGYLLGRLDPEAASTPVPLEARPSIAVLPLENRSGQEEQAHFADGMTDEVIATLTRIEGLRVVPRPSVMRYQQADESLPEMAQHLGVDYFVNGSVLWAGEQVRITINLLDPTTETALWGDSFVGEQQDVFALQQEVARAIAQEVEAQVTPEDEARLGQTRQVDPKAYELYRRGRHIFERSVSEGEVARLQKAMPYYEQAITIDSTFAEAYARLGNAYMLFGTYGVLPWGEAEPKATWYLEKALELDDTLPYAYRTRGFQLEHNRNWAEAEVALRHAIDLAPGDPNSYCELGLLMVRTGRLEEALDRATTALGLDPISGYAHMVTMYAYLFSHQYDEAITWSLKMLELYPDDWIGHWGLGYAYLGKGLHQEALEVFEELVTLDSIRIGNLGYAYAVMGRREEALRVLEALKEPGAGHFNIRINIARIYTALGEREQALDWLEQNYRPLGYLKVDPTFDSLRAEPRFQALLKKMGLDP